MYIAKCLRKKDETFKVPSFLLKHFAMYTEVCTHFLRGIYTPLILFRRINKQVCSEFLI